MNKILWVFCFISFLFLGCSSKKSANIELKIIGYDSKSGVVIKVADGIDALPFWVPDTLYPNKKGVVDIKIPAEKPCFFSIQFLQSNGKYSTVPIYITKSGNYEITSNLNKTSTNIIFPTFKGKNEKGVLQYINFIQFNKDLIDKNQLFSTQNPDTLLIQLNQKRDIELKPFDNLLKNQDIDDDFYEFALNYINYEFINNVLTFISTKINDNDTISSEKWENLKTDLLNNYPISNPYLYQSGVGKIMIDKYISDLIQMDKVAYDEALKNSLGQTFILKKLKTAIHPDVYKYYALQYLDSKTIRFDKETISLFNLYASEFSNTKSSIFYKRIQNESIPAIQKFYASNQASLSSEIVVIDDLYPFTSFQQIIQKFSGQYIFIDIWASWCPDCISEFKYNEVLKSYLKEKNIPIVYIAFERSPDRDKWKLYLNKYNLTGNHIKCTDELKEDLYRILGTRSIWIPRYMLINPAGGIEIMDAPTPSSGKKLYDLISSKLNSTIVNPK